MARRKKHYKKRSHRRKIGAAGTGMTGVLSIVAGAVIGRVIAKKFTTINPTIMNGGQIAAGFILPRFVKNKFVAGIGTGMVVNGAVGLLQSTGVIGAIGSIGETDEDTYQLSGSSTIQEIAGMDEMDSGDQFSGIDDGIMSGGGSSDIAILAGDDWDTEY